MKDFHHWDDIFTKASQSVTIGEGDNGVEIVAETKKVETGKSIYSGMFVTGGTMEDERKDEKRKRKVKTEEELFEICGGRDGRKFRQHGKHARYVFKWVLIVLSHTYQF